jgi:hypothetical protein
MIKMLPRRQIQFFLLGEFACSYTFVREQLKIRVFDVVGDSLYGSGYGALVEFPENSNGEHATYLGWIDLSYFPGWENNLLRYAHDITDEQAVYPLVKIENATIEKTLATARVIE